MILAPGGGRYYRQRGEPGHKPDAPARSLTQVVMALRDPPTHETAEGVFSDQRLFSEEPDAQAIDVPSLARRARVEPLAPGAGVGYRGGMAAAAPDGVDGSLTPPQREVLACGLLTSGFD